MPGPLNETTGVVSMASMSVATAGGTILTLRALLSTAFGTVAPHTVVGSSRTVPNPENALYGPHSTPTTVPDFVVAEGGAAGMTIALATNVACPGAVCGRPLNEVGSGLVVTLVVVLIIDDLVW